MRRSAHTHTHSQLMQSTTGPFQNTGSPSAFSSLLASCVITATGQPSLHTRCLNYPYYTTLRSLTINSNLQYQTRWFKAPPPVPANAQSVQLVFLLCPCAIALVPSSRVASRSARRGHVRLIPSTPPHDLHYYSHHCTRRMIIQKASNDHRL